MDREDGSLETEKCVVAQFDVDIRSVEDVAPESSSVRRQEVQANRFGIDRLASLAVTLASIAALVVGWLNRNDGHLTPESGLGYWLGLVGGSMMLLLLIYPLRKRLRSLRLIGSVPGWFRLHMLLGIVGPILILYHANFKLGSNNSNVALATMLLVAGSGLVGRYLYRQIHAGLYGQKMNLAGLLADVRASKSELDGTIAFDENSIAMINDYTATAMKTSGSFSGSLSTLVSVSFRAPRLRKSLMINIHVAVEREARHQHWTWLTRRRELARVRKSVDEMIWAVRKASAFAVYERLFAMWHVLHLPLFILLIVTAVLHVVAVHTY
jgi:hypothetical protein